VAAVDDLEGLVWERQRLADSGAIVDGKSRRDGVRPRSLQRGLRGIDPRDVAAEPRELLGQETASAAHIECGLATKIGMQSLGQYAAEVAEPGGIERRAQHREPRSLIPPDVAR